MQSQRNRVTARRWWVVVGGFALTVAAVLGVAQLLSISQRPDIKPECTAVSQAGTARLAPDQAANAALIAAVAQGQGMSPRAVTIGLATALQESKLRNLSYGDRDSLGLFQQRPSQGWGTAEQVQDPLYAAAKFFEALAEVPGFEQMPITEAAQAVQRSAYPEAYAAHEATARSFASALTGHSPAGLACTFQPADLPGSAETFRMVHRAEWGSPIATAIGSQVIITAGDPTQAWASAAWAVAKGAELGVDSVEVAGQRWRRTTGQWEALPEDQLPSAQVLVTMAEG